MYNNNIGILRPTSISVSGNYSVDGNELKNIYLYILIYISIAIFSRKSKCVYEFMKYNCRLLLKSLL